jgi:histidine phosphotransferase ChpT
LKEDIVHQDEASLAALIGSRICHDLINPIGAISNGLELFGMGGATQDGPEMSLIQQSCNNATARIRFFRIAFGSAGDLRPIPSAQARKTLADHYTGTRIAPDWRVVQDLRRDVTQLGYLCVLCLETALPQGGSIRVNVSEDALIAAAEAESLRADGTLWSMLTEPASKPCAELRPADVQFGLLARLCADLGLEPDLAHEHGHATLRIPLHGQ